MKPFTKTIGPLWMLGTFIALMLMLVIEDSQASPRLRRIGSRTAKSISIVRRVRGRVSMYTPTLRTSDIINTVKNNRRFRDRENKYRDRDSNNWRNIKSSAALNFRTKALQTQAFSRRPEQFTTVRPSGFTQVSFKTTRTTTPIQAKKNEITLRPTQKPQINVATNIKSRSRSLGAPLALNFLTDIHSPAEANYLALRKNFNSNKARQYTSTTTTTTTLPPVHVKKRSIKDEVGNMINQLKADLESLLKFNENYLSFNSSIVKNAVKSKVEDFFGTISTAIDTQVSDVSDEVTSEDSVEAAADILNVTQHIGKSVASTLEIGGTSEIKLANISMLVLKKQNRMTNGHSCGVSRWNSGAGVQVSLPDQPSLTGSNDTISLSFTSYKNLGQMMSDNRKTGATIRSPVLSVNVVGTTHNSKKRSIPLKEPVEFEIKHKPMKKVRKRKCTYWEFKYAKWSDDGCYELRKKSTETRTVCKCYHLTDFAIAVEELDDNDLEHSTSSALLSWEYLNYFSSKPVTPVTVTDGLQFGDKLGATQTSDITTSPPQPQPVFHPEPSDFHVYGVSETTESGEISRVTVVPVLNDRKYAGDVYNWVQFGDN